MVTALHEAQEALPADVTSSRRRPRALDVAGGVGGLALATLVGLDGSPVWQVVRVVVVAAVTTLLLAVLARSSIRWRGTIATIAGVPAIGIAAGFAPHWVKGGPVPVQVAAAALACAGLALVAGGTAVAAEGERWWRRLAAGLAATVAVAMAALVLGPPVAATNVPPSRIGATPTSVGLEYTDLALRTADGVDLAAWYVPSANGAAVVLLHGAGSTRSDVLEQAAVLARAGYGVLMVDARGHGESGGRAMDFGWYGDADVAAATSYLVTRPDVERHRIGAVGMSMGGEQAIGATADNEVLRSIVAEGATARSAVDLVWLSSHHGVRGALQEQIERLQERVTDVLTSASVPASLRSAVEASGDTQYLLIAAGEVADEAHAATYIAAGAPDRVQVWTVAGADHTGGLATAPEEWADRVIGFLNETLRA